VREMEREEEAASGQDVGDAAPALLEPCEPSRFRAWLYLIQLSIQRQARAGQVVWIALGLLLFSTLLVVTFTAGRGWSVKKTPWPRTRDYRGPSYAEWADLTEAAGNRAVLPGSPETAGVNQALSASFRAAMAQSEIFTFSNAIVFLIFVSFLMPIWCLSFATEAVGGEREGSSLVWLLTRPLPRPAIYLAKYLAQLPWSLGLTLGGFIILCLAAGRPGRLAIRLYWPAVLCGVCAYTALYYFIGAFFKRPAVIALVYSFFLETIMGNMPGYLKRASLSFYTRCMMFDAGQAYGVEPEKSSVYLAVDGTTACIALLGATAAFLALGIVLFSRKEYVTAD